MTQPKNSESINGAKLRCFKKPDNYWSDPLHNYNIEGYEFSVSRTFMPKGTEFIKAQDEAEMLREIKKNHDIKFKDQDLAEITREWLLDNGVEVDNVQDDRNE